MAQVLTSLVLGANVVDLRALNFNAAARFWFDKGTTAGHFDIYGILDSTTGNATQNAQPLGGFDVSPGQTEVPPELRNALLGWPLLLVVAPGSATFIVEGNASTSTTTNQSVTAPVGTAFSTLMNISSYNTSGVRVMGSKSMTSADQFNVYGTNDLTTTPSATGLNGAQFLGNIFGSSGLFPTPGTSLVVAGWAAVFFQRDPSSSGATVGTIQSCGVAAPVVPGSTYWLIGGNPNGGLMIGGSTDNSPVRIQSGTGALGLGDTATNHPTTVGSVTGASLTTVQGGASGVTVDSGTGPVVVGGTSTTVTLGNVGAGVSTSMLGVNGSIQISPAGVRLVSSDGAVGIGLTANNGGTIFLNGSAGSTISVGANAFLITTNVGSITSTSSTAIQAGTGVLTFRRNGNTWTWPSAFGAAGSALTDAAGNGTLSWAAVPASVSPIAAFAAATSLTTAVAQNVPPGSALLASSTDLGLGAIMPKAGGLTLIQIKFTGSVANVGGQTVSVSIFKNGTIIAASTVAGIATTAGAQTGSLTYASQAFVAGDVLTAQILPSGVLTAALTDVMVSCA